MIYILKTEPRIVLYWPGIKKLFHLFFFQHKDSNLQIGERSEKKVSTIQEIRSKRKLKNTGKNKNNLLSSPLGGANLTGFASFRAPAVNFRLIFSECCAHTFIFPYCVLHHEIQNFSLVHLTLECSLSCSMQCTYLRWTIDQLLSPQYGRIELVIWRALEQQGL